MLGRFFDKGWSLVEKLYFIEKYEIHFSDAIGKYTSTLLYLIIHSDMFTFWLEKVALFTDRLEHSKYLD